MAGKGTDQACTGFQQDFVDAASGQGLQQRRQVDLTIVTWQAQQFVAGSGIARVICDSGHHQCRAGLEERRRQWQAQAAIDQYAQRRTAESQGCGFGIQAQLGATHGHARIVGQHAGGAGQHHAGTGAQALHR
ncbi:hypothetical protein D3C76_1114930 [compost metagenome]